MSYAASTLADLRGRITGLLGQLRALADPAGPGEALLAAMSEAEAGGSAAALKDDARVLANAVEELQGQLREVLTQAEKIEPRQRRDVLDVEGYWLKLKETLDQAAKRSEEALRAAWLKSFAEAFAGWRLDLCERLAREDLPADPELEQMRRTFSAAITALRGDERAAALPAVELLVEDHPAGLPASPLDEVSRAAAFLVLGRIRLHDSTEEPASLACFERAREAAPQDGRVHAALAEYYRAISEDTTARDLSRRAIALSPDRPEGYVSMALSCEAQGWWDEASDWHAQAVEAILRRAASGDPLAELGQLLAPVSGALYLRLADAIWRTNPRGALAAAEKAIELGINGEGEYPQRAAYQLKGDVLEVLQRPAEAAEALSLAAQYSAGNKDGEPAFELFRRASKLDPKLVSNYWHWADALLIASYFSKPPYVDKDRISQSLDAWNLGAKVALPDDDHYWAYLTRAGIAQQLARLPGADRWQHSWEAVVFVEQSLLLNPTRALAWVILGEMHNSLDNELNALHATETALLCDAEDIDAIETRISLLSNLERHAEVQPLLAKRRAMSPSATAWINAVEAYSVVQQFPAAAGTRECEAALAALDASPDEAPWSGINRARLLRALGRRSEAKEQYKKLSDRFDELDIGSHLSYAWAKMMTGDANDLDTALRILTARSSDRVSGLASIERDQGFCRLLRGEDAQARDHFDRAIAIGTARELEAWRDRDIEADEVLEALAGRPQAGQAREMLDQCKAAALKRRAALEVPDKPEQELQRVIAALRTGNETEGWSWIAPHAGVARFELEAGRWREAEEAYRALHRYAGHFHTAQQGLEQALYGLAVESGGAESGALPEDRTRLARIHGQRADLERRRRSVRLYGQTGMQRVLTVTPIAIEAAGNLRHTLEGPDGNLEPTFAHELDYLCRWLDDLLGFTVPSIGVRTNEYDLPDGTYVIIINEVPLVSGHIDLEQGLCNETVDHLALLSIKGEEAVNPANGSECSWIRRDDWQKAKDAGLEIRTPAQYILLHLAAVIRKNSTDLIGVQAVADLLMARAQDRHSGILSVQGGLPRFTSVLQALLAEEVSIRELPSICDCYLSNAELPTYEIPEEIRRLEAVRKDIPGNTPDTPVWLLGRNLVSVVEGGIQRDGEAAVLAIEPEPTQEALTAVRNEVASLPPTTRNPVLFVENWHMRPFVRKLVELEFPHLAVLSRREAIAADERPILGTIEMESRGRPERR